MSYDEELQRQLDERQLDEERQNELDYERQHHEELQREYEMQQHLSYLYDIADYLVDPIVERLGEFALSQSDTEYILKSLSDLVQKELDKQQGSE